LDFSHNVITAHSNQTIHNSSSSLTRNVLRWYNCMTHSNGNVYNFSAIINIVSRVYNIILRLSDVNNVYVEMSLFAVTIMVIVFNNVRYCVY